MHVYARVQKKLLTVATREITLGTAMTTTPIKLGGAIDRRVSNIVHRYLYSDRPSLRSLGSNDVQTILSLADSIYELSGQPVPVQKLLDTAVDYLQRDTYIVRKAIQTLILSGKLRRVGTHAATVIPVNEEEA